MDFEAYRVVGSVLNILIDGALTYAVQLIVVTLKMDSRRGLETTYHDFTIVVLHFFMDCRLVLGVSHGCVGGRGGV